MAKKRKGFKLKWPVTPEQSQYMARRQEENIEVAKRNPNEAWMAEKLKGIGLKWSRQSRWGYRIFDFWNAEKGIAVEVDGPTHKKDWDEKRDRYNYERSAIVVIRVRNLNEEDATSALERIAELGTWNERREKMGLKPVRACTMQIEKKKRLLAEGKDIMSGGRMRYSGY